MLIISKIIFLFISIFSWNNFLASQVLQEWALRYNGTANGYDEIIAIVTDAVGNIYVTGYNTRISGTSNTDYVTIKYSSAGNQEWIAIYNGTGNDTDYPEAIAIDISGNVYVTGWSKGIGLNFDYTTIKYNSSGIQQWVVRYNGIGNDIDQSRSVAIDNIGNIYITGQSYSSVSRYDCITIKYNSSGNQQWIARYNNLNNGDGGYTVKTDKLGNVYVAGYSSNIGSQEDFLTIKYNSSGIQQWAVTYDGTSHQTDVAKYLVLDDSGNVYIAGSSSGSSNYADYVAIKYNSLGVEQWSRRYNGSADFFDRPCGIGLDKNSNVYIGGYSTESSTGYDFTAIKYNKNGQQLWVSHYNNVLNDFARSMAMDSSGNVYITGDIIRSSTGSDYATVKFDSSGILQWSKIYSTVGDSSDIPNSIAVDNSGNVFVAGYVNQQHADYMTIKYSQLTNVNHLSSEIPTEYKLFQNYPNPFNPITVISYQLAVSSDIVLKVFDVLGNEIATLVNEKKNPGSYEVEWDASDYPSGIYFYSLLVDGNIIDTKRMILLK